MRSLESVINDMKSTQLISRSKQQNSTSIEVATIAGCYADLIQNWISNLEEANRIISMQTAIRVPIVSVDFTMES